jgi:EF-hand domain-containing protein 1
VLRVFAHSQEGVAESPEEAFRVRKYVLCYRGADGTLEINEPREDNSGLIQGPTLSRQRVPKGAPDVRAASATIAGLTGAAEGADTATVEYVDWRDLQVGAEVCIFGRTYHIYDADGFTRSWFAARDVVLADAEPVPVDVVGARLELAKRSGGKTDKGHNKVMFPAKTYAEARLGKFIRDPEERRKFQVSCGPVVWWGWVGWGGVVRCTTHHIVACPRSLPCRTTTARC